jgi:hypothetical protein
MYKKSLVKRMVRFLKRICEYNEFLAMRQHIIDKFPLALINDIYVTKDTTAYFTINDSIYNPEIPAEWKKYVILEDNLWSNVNYISGTTENIDENQMDTNAVMDENSSNPPGIIISLEEPEPLLKLDGSIEFHVTFSDEEISQTDKFQKFLSNEYPVKLRDFKKEHGKVSVTITFKKEE